MSTQQDIYAASFESRPPMLNKENYVPWSSRLLWYAKSRPNGKLIHNSIINGPYVRRMIPEPGDTNREVPVNETFHVQTDDELTEKKLKQIEVDDQAIQTILLGLLEDIYAAADSCETAQEIYQNGIDMLLTFIRQRTCIQLITLNSPHQDQPSFNQNYMQQPMPNPEDITDPITAMNMALTLMAKAFKLNYSTPTNNNQMILSNPRNLNGYKDVQNVRNQVTQHAIQNPRTQNEEVGIQLQAEEFDLMAAAADLDEIKEVNANCILMANLQQAVTSGTQTDKAPVYDSDGSTEVHNYKDFYDNEIFNMFTQEEQYAEQLEPIIESHQVPQNDNNVISEVTSKEQSGGTVEQHPANVEETRALYESLYQNLAIEVEKVNTVNRKLKETNTELTTELTRFKNQEKCFEISQEKYDKLERCYQQSVYQEQCISKNINALHLSSGKQIMALKEEILDLNKQLSKEKSTVSFLLEEKKRLKSDFKIREDELLDKQIQLKKRIKELDNILVKTGQSIQTIHMLSLKTDSFYHTEQKMALGYQNPFYLKQAPKKQQSLYDGKVLLEKHDPPVVHDSEETLQLAQEKTHNWSSSAHQELYKIVKDENFPIINQVDARVQNFEIQFLKEAAKFVGDFKSLAKEADDYLAKHKALELEIERLLRAVVSQDIMSVKNEYAKLWNDWYKKCDERKFDKISYDKAYKDMQQKIKRLQAQLGDLKGKSKDTSCVSDTPNPLSQKLENKNVELEFQDNICGTSTNTKFAKQSILGNPPTLGMFRINPFKTSREEKYVPNTVRASAGTKPITVLQPPVFTKKDVNSDSNGLSSTGLDNTKTRRPHPRSNTKNNRKFMGTVRFENDHVAVILGFGDLQRGNILITRVYFVEGLGHNLFSVGQFCDSDLESWLWHQRLSYLNFDTINDLAKNDLVSGLPKFKYHKEHRYPSCEQGKIKRASHPPKPVPNSRHKLHLLHMDLCGLMRIASINGKRYVLVIMDDYSRYTWVHFLRSKDEAPEDEAIATACFTHNRSIIHRRFNKTPYELINGKKPDISFLHVFGALCYPKNDREDIRKLGAKGDIGFFIGYSVDSCAYRVYNRRAKKIIETMNVSFDELSAMAFEQCSSKLGFQSMTSGQISSGLDLTYAPSTIITQQLTECELDLLFEAMYNDFISGQPSATQRTVLAAQAQQVHQTSTTSTSIADSAPTPTNSSSLATNFPNTSHDVDELNSQQHAQQQGIQAHLQSKTVADNVPNAMFDGNTFVNPFANPSTLIGEPSRPVLIRNQLRSDGDMCMYALMVSTMEPKNVKEAMTGPAWIKSMQEELLQFKRLDNHFFKGTIDPTLFIRRFDDDILVSSYVLKILKKYEMESCDPIVTPMEIKDKLDLDQNGTPVGATKYRRMIGEKLVSWSSKKQDCMALSTVEAEYVSLSACCAQVLWMRAQLTDYGFHLKKIPIYYDLKSAIAISRNPVQQSRTKHIIDRYHFIKEHVEKGTIELYFVKTDYQLATYSPKLFWQIVSTIWFVALVRIVLNFTKFSQKPGNFNTRIKNQEAKPDQEAEFQE
nr:hypothetical protein [Tanacetum cinerariifolium]